MQSSQLYSNPPPLIKDASQRNKSLATSINHHHHQKTSLNRYLGTPSLLQERVDKLPATIKLNRVISLQTVLAADVSVFRQWLFYMAFAVNRVLATTTFYSTTFISIPKLIKEWQRKKDIYMIIQKNYNVNQELRKSTNKESY